MAYPEPSRSDHDAPWNIVTLEDEDGEEYDACGCISCERGRMEQDREDSGYYDDLYEQMKDRRMGL